MLEPEPGNNCLQMLDKSSVPSVQGHILPESVTASVPTTHTKQSMTWSEVTSREKQVDEGDPSKHPSN